MRVPIDEEEVVPVTFLVLMGDHDPLGGQLAVQGLCGPGNHIKKVEIGPIQLEGGRFYLCQVEQIVNQVQDHGRAKDRVLQ